MPSIKSPSQHELFDVPLHEIHLHRAMDLMLKGLSKKVKKATLLQRRFIESANSHFNRLELSAKLDEFCKYKLRHWVRSNWVVHDLRAEMGRWIRCEWYQEHTRWGMDDNGYGLDQLSFAHMMARAEVERRTSTKEQCRSLEYSTPFADGSYTDEEDWHPLVNSLDDIDSSFIVQFGDEPLKRAVRDSMAEKSDLPTLPFVRILNTWTSIFERTLWKHQKINLEKMSKKNR